MASSIDSLLPDSEVDSGADVAFQEVQAMCAPGSALIPRNQFIIKLKRDLGVTTEDAYSFVVRMEDKYKTELQSWGYTFPL